MKALQFIESVPRWLISKALGRFFPEIYTSKVACVVYREVPEPELPGEEWVKIKVKYAGICGSDLNLIFLHDSPSTSPFVSFPFTIGHENVGTVAKVGREAKGLQVGQRVIVDPILSCRTRGVALCEPCQKGDNSLCLNFRDGDIAPGMLIGACRDTGGSFSSYFVAHRSQVIPVPDRVSDEAAVLVDAFASALHPVLRNYPKDSDKVLIIGAGAIGLSAVAALRGLGSRAEIAVLAKYPFQGNLARQLGADQVIYRRGDYYEEVADFAGARTLRPMIGKKVFQGGVDLVYECVGSSSSIDDALRFAGPGGTVVLVGLASEVKVDWTPIWLKELRIKGAFCYTDEEYEGQKTSTYRLALQLMAEGKVDVAPLLTHKYPLSEYRRAIKELTDKRNTGAIKAVFAID
ncbi:MAG: alcohol dehydrogenase catalytic domain-containing protein [Bacillota bacterium]